MDMALNLDLARRVVFFFGGFLSGDELRVARLAGWSHFFGLDFRAIHFTRVDWTVFVVRLKDDLIDDAHVHGFVLLDRQEFGLFSDDGGLHVTQLAGVVVVGIRIAMFHFWRQG